VLYGLYNSLLTQLESLPREAAYRQKTEQIVQQRLQVVKAETDVSLLEQKIGCGQAEELIEQVGGARGVACVIQTLIVKLCFLIGPSILHEWVWSYQWIYCKRKWLC